MSQTSKNQTVNMLFKLKDKKTHNTLKNHIVTRQKLLVQNDKKMADKKKTKIKWLIF